ncbi:hypothetical protein [uncultured Vagococcus sp.]|uniref:hypothetical protein n=1 Tax=uncultured Vagococcus sp. TaxID=189676 RepID=UPI0028D13D05|nr:hypothetical protein [uncultured Vagococcus sp.]
MKKKLVALLLILGLSSVVGSPVYANNHVDKPLPSKKIGFEFSQAADKYLENKEDDSYHYIKNTSGFNLWVRSFSNT